MFPGVWKKTGLNDRRFSRGDKGKEGKSENLLSLGSAKGKEEKVKQYPLTQAALVKEVDKLSSRIWELQGKETEARKKKLVGLANDYRRQWEALEPGYMLAYRRYVRIRPKKVNVSRGELWSTGVS